MKTYYTLFFCLCSLSFVNAQTMIASNSIKNDAALTNRSTVNETYLTNGTESPALDDKTTTNTYHPKRIKNPKVVGGTEFAIYVGVNSTKFSGESFGDVSGANLKGRLGYQLGALLRFGGRVFGQIGAEYFASSSNYFTKGDGNTIKTIQDQINIKYIQVPVYLGFRVIEAPAGGAALRLQAGLEYAHRIGENTGGFNFTNDQLKQGSFNALGQVGLDFGPLMINLTYHHGLSDSIKNPITGSTANTGFAGSQRRIISASVGLNF